MKDHADIQKKMREVHNEISDVKGQFAGIEASQSDLRQEIRNKANMNKLEHIEMQLMDFATKMDFSKLLNKLEAYTTLESFNKMRIAAEALNHSM